MTDSFEYIVLMKDFLEGFHFFLKKNKKEFIPEQMILSKLFGEENEETESDGLWNLLKKYCRLLCKKEMYGTVLEFMYGAIVHLGIKEPARLYELMDEITVRNKREENGITLKAMYDELSGDPALTAGCDHHTVPTSVLHTVLSDIYGLDVKESGITTEAVDRLTDPAKPENIAAVLFGPFKQAVCDQRTDECFYIMERAWKAFDRLHWEDGNALNEILYRNYLSYFHSLMTGLLCGDRAWLKISSYNRNAYLEDCRGIDTGLFGYGRELFGGKRDLAKRMASVFEKSYAYVSKEVSFYYDPYSYLCAAIVYMLWCSAPESGSEEIEFCVSFLADHYDQLAKDEKSNVFMYVVLVRCILMTEDAANASVLYGYYNYETCAYIHNNKGNFLRKQRELADYLDRVKTHIGQLDKRLFADDYEQILYGDGKLDKLKREIDRLNDGDELMGDAVWRDLRLVMLAFMDQLGIKTASLPWSPLKEKDLIGALSTELKAQAKRCFTMLEEYRENVPDIIWFSDCRDSIDILVQSRFLELLEKAFDRYNAEFSKLRSDIIDGLPGGASGELTEEAVSLFMNRMEEPYTQAYTKLAKVIPALRSKGFADAIDEIKKCQEKFVRNYCTDDKDTPDEIKKDLFHKLPDREKNDVFGYIVNSEMVFSYLKEKENSGETVKVAVDYSPALLPLTKALERVMNVLFENMETPTSLSEYVKKYYLEKNGQKKSGIELGACVHLLDRSNFEAFGGNAVLDVSRLRRIADCGKTGMNPPIRLRVKKKNDDERQSAGRNDGKSYLEREFTSADAENLALLRDALDYIRENYRNPVAHKDPISRETVEECRELLIQSKNLLWILLYMIKEEKLKKEK